MDWKTGIQGFLNHLRLERGLSGNSLDAYRLDVEKLAQFSELQDVPLKVSSLTTEDLERFMAYLHEIGMGASSQARILSGIRAFFKYAILEGIREDNPANIIEGPRQSRKLPEVLDPDEMITVLESIDLSLPQGHRNRAILEVLYASGLRVSELIELRLSNLFAEAQLLRIIGKGNKERIVPIGKEALHYLKLYVQNERTQLSIQKGEEDIIFLNRRGKRLSRQMIFLMIKKVVAEAGIQKSISPHTFRHSFASHMVEGGADLRAVQEMLGHESILTTEIYTHLQQSYLQDTIDQFHPRSRYSKKS